MGLGDPVIVKDRISPSRFNAKTYHWMDATALGNLPTTPCMIVIPTSSGGVFTQDEPMFRLSNNLSWRLLGMRAHNHDGATSNQGGELVDIELANIGKHIEIDRFGQSAGMWIKKISGTGSDVTDDIPTGGTRARILINAGTTLNAYAHGMIIGPEIDWGHVSRFITIFQIMQDTTCLARVGIGAEDVNIANTITKKYGVEACDNATEGKFYLLFSSDGIARTTSGSTFAMNYGSPSGVHVLHQPNMNVKMTVDGQDTIPPLVVKGNNIPSNGGYSPDATDSFAIVKAGILAKAASAARQLRLHAFKYVGDINSLRIFQSPPTG